MQALQNFAITGKNKSSVLMALYFQYTPTLTQGNNNPLLSVVPSCFSVKVGNSETLICDTTNKEAFSAFRKHILEKADQIIICSDDETEITALSSESQSLNKTFIVIRNDIDLQSFLAEVRSIPSQSFTDQRSAEIPTCS